MKTSAMKSLSKDIEKAMSVALPLEKRSEMLTEEEFLQQSIKQKLAHLASTYTILKKAANFL